MCLTTSVLAACVETPAPSPSLSYPVTPQPEADFELPAPVYFLREGQIWYLARDGKTQQQITREAAAVESFDFMATSAARWEAPEAFGLYKVGSDGGGTTVRTDEHAIQAVLWARDDRGVLIVTGSA